MISWFHRYVPDVWDENEIKSPLPYLGVCVIEYIILLYIAIVDAFDIPIVVWKPLLSAEALVALPFLTHMDLVRWASMCTLAVGVPQRLIFPVNWS